MNHDLIREGAWGIGLPASLRREPVSSATVWGCVDSIRNASRAAQAVMLLGIGTLFGDLVSVGHRRCHADVFGTSGNPLVLDFVTVRDPGNQADANGKGAVGYVYRMAVYEASEGDVSFANAAGGLGIGQSSRGPTMPATLVSWNEAARFVNWLNTSRGYSPAYKFSTQPGAGGYSATAAAVQWSVNDVGYDAANPWRNSNAKYHLPNFNEWYKAAYFDPAKPGGAGYWLYPTRSDSPPTAVASGTSPGTAVYNAAGPAAVNAAGGLGPYGTMGQGGNVYEWHDAPDERGTLGGSYAHGNANQQLSSADWRAGATTENVEMGFRVASRFFPQMYWAGGSDSVTAWSDFANAGGGSGAWTEATLSWDPELTAIFAGSAGTVTVGSVTAGRGLQFAVDGYQLAGGSIALSGATATDNSITVTSGTAMVASVLSGGATGIEKAGNGTLVLTGENASAGSFTISAGTLEAGHASALGSGGVTIDSGATLRLAAGAIIPNVITNSGTLQFAGGGLRRTSTENLALPMDLLAGSAAEPISLAPSISWLAKEEATFSDVLSLTNTSGQVQLLQMAYDPSLLGEIAEADLFLGWKSDGTWVNAIAGNGPAGGSAVLNGLGSFTSLGVTPTAAYLGSWGRDPDANTVWAVVDHNSQFAVVAVPEPGGMAMVGGAIAAAVMAGWRPSTGRWTFRYTEIQRRPRHRGRIPEPTAPPAPS